MAIVEEVVNRSIYYPTHPSLINVLDVRIKKVQKPFLDPELVLPYTRSLRTVSDFNSYGETPDTPWDATGTQAATWLSYHQTSSEDKKALSKAYSKLINDLELAKSGMGETLAEGKKGIAMIVQRARQLGKAYSSLRRGRFRDFLGALKARPLNHHRKTRWTKPKNASAIWLEYWLGWAPMIKSIYDATDVLCSDFNKHMDGPVKISGTSACKFSHKGQNLSGLNKSWYEVTGEVRYKLGCQVQLENPNSLLMNQMGVVNPVSVAWALVPFSFIAGWFVNIQQVLNSYTDFVGMKVTRQYTTRCITVSGSQSREYWWYGNKLLRASSISCKAYEMVRTTSLTLPKVYFSVPAGLSPSRGATAMALLVSLFTKG